MIALRTPSVSVRGALVLVMALWAWAIPWRAEATPVATARVGGRGLLLTVTAFASDTLPGCTFSAPGDATHRDYRVLARDDTAGWVLVHREPPVGTIAPSTGEATGETGRSVAIETPNPGHHIQITWGSGSRSETVEAFMGHAASTTIEVRLLTPHSTATGTPTGSVQIPEGAAVIDGMNRLLGVVVGTEGDRAFVVPAVLALAEIRDAGIHTPPVCREGVPHGGGGHTVHLPTGVCPALPETALPVILRDRAQAAVLWDHDAVLGVSVLGDGLMVAAARQVSMAVRGCTGPIGPCRGELVSVDAATGLALVRTDRRTVTGLPFGRAPVHCDRLSFFRNANGGTTQGTVEDVGEGELRVHLASGSTVPEGSPAIDDDGALVGVVSRAAHDEVLVTLVGALPQTVALVGATGPSPACTTPSSTVPPSLTEQDVDSLGDPLGSLVTHVGTDSIYATLGDRMSDVAVGCVVRRTGRPQEEVLGVDAIANVGIFHPVRRFGNQIPMTIPGEEPPLRLVDERPADGTVVWVAMAPGPTTPVRAVVVRGTGDEIVLGETPAIIPHGAPVLDASGRLVGLVDRPLGEGQHLVRSSAVLRRMLTRLRRNEGTPGCSAAYGAILGSVVALNFLTGFRISTPSGVGAHFPVSVGVLWYNTWWARGELGFTLPNDSMSVLVAGGPLLYRSAGDGEVGIGGHVEFEVPFTTSQDTPGSPDAVRALYGFEFEASPYLSNSVGLMFTLAFGLSQHGDYTQDHFGFGTTFMLGFDYGSLRRDRP